MKEKSPEELLEEQADALLEEDAAKRGETLRQAGILNRDRLRLIARREIPMSSLRPNESHDH